MVVVVIATTEDTLGSVISRVQELGAGAPTVRAPSALRRVVLATANDPWEAERIAAALRAEGMTALARPAEGPRLDAWHNHTAPVTFGTRLAVCFAWSEHDRPQVAHTVELGLGGFGNGAHPTTRMIITELLDRLTGGERVLDVGCGSGVLGLCAAALGARQVVAVDLLADAVEATRRNAVLNGLEAQVDAPSGGLAAVEDSFDVIVANIGRAGLVELAPQLSARLAPGGWLAASGFAPSQSTLVGGFFPALAETQRRSDGDWAMVTFSPR